METKDRDILEGLVDGYSLTEVMEALAEICDEKADHILTNWQDEKTSKVWTHVALKIAQVPCLGL
jgi:hypothetical protein